PACPNNRTAPCSSGGPALACLLRVIWRSGQCAPAKTGCPSAKFWCGPNREELRSPRLPLNIACYRRRAGGPWRAMPAAPERLDEDVNEANPARRRRQRHAAIPDAGAEERRL